MNTKGVITKEENSIKNEPIEHLRIFNQEGKLLLKQKGSKSKIILTKKQMKLLPTSVVSHNHPNGTPLSLDDIIISLSYKVKEARVVTSNGITYVLEITDESIYEYIDLDILEDEYKRLHEEYYNKDILGCPKKKHNSRYQKLFSKILHDLFDDVEGIDYYEIGEYKE